MPITHTWSVANLERQVDGDGVTIVHWRLNSTDETNTASAYGTTSHRPNSESDSYTPYGDLTEDNVLDWVWLQINRDATEERLEAKIDLLANPTTASGLPW
ncbi:MAG: hypothetical protein P8P29_03650 [Flavobacteriaceae bacterium]|nr:hypothetical protein [Flavobacteriaceae bacterium]